MKLLTPNSKDISDVGLAIKSFKGAWGSINPIGYYEPMINGKTLWLMFNFEVSNANTLFEETAPAKYAGMVDKGFEANSGVIHAQASKIKTGFFSHAWVLKVTYMIDNKTLPLGFLGAPDQATLWRRLHNTLSYKERFLLTAKTATTTF